MEQQRKTTKRQYASTKTKGKKIQKGKKTTINHISDYNNNYNNNNNNNNNKITMEKINIIDNNHTNDINKSEKIEMVEIEEMKGFITKELSNDNMVFQKMVDDGNIRDVDDDIDNNNNNNNNNIDGVGNSGDSMFVSESENESEGSLDAPTPFNKQLKRARRRTIATTTTTTTTINQGIQERLWEKEKLHEINLRVDNIFNVVGNKRESKKDSVSIQMLEELQNQHNKMMKELSEEFLEKERKKSEELINLKAENDTWKDKNVELNSELENSQSTIEQLRMDLANIKKEKEDVIREKTKAMEYSQNLKDALEAQLKMLQGDTTCLYEPLDNPSFSSVIKEQLEKRFSARLAELLQDRDDQHNMWKEQVENAFKKQIDELEQDYKKKITNLTNHADTQAKELEELRIEILKLSQERDQAISELETKKHVYEMAENELRNQRDNINEELKCIKEKLMQTEKEQRDSNNLNFELEKVNLHLRTEIEALKHKLDAFEEQYKIASPVRPAKRRRIDLTSMEPKVLKSVQGPLIESHSSFPLECITVQYEGDWKGFELQNQWNKSIILKDWTLTNIDQSSRLQLPEKILNSNDIIRVCLTDNKKESSDLIWKDLEIKRGEQQELWVEDNLGFRRKISNFPLPPATSTFRDKSCFVM